MTLKKTSKINSIDCLDIYTNVCNYFRNNGINVINKQKIEINNFVNLLLINVK